jgi:hypothetical protein
VNYSKSIHARNTTILHHHICQKTYHSNHHNSTGRTNKTSMNFMFLCTLWTNRVFHTVRKTRYRYAESGPKLTEIKKKPCKKVHYPSRGRNSEMQHFLCQTEFHPILTRLSFFLSASTGATYIFTTPTCTTTIVTSNCALAPEFQHFIPRFNKTSLLCRPHSKRG